MAAPSLFFAVLSLVVVLVVESALVVPPPPSDTKILGGHKIAIEDAPWQVFLHIDKLMIRCGGSILGPQWVLTAAHCTNCIPSSLIKIRIGSALAYEGGKLYDVLQVIEHGEYRLNGFNDLALIKTTELMDLSPPVKAVTLIGLGDKRPDVGTMLTVSGWGRTESGNASTELLAVEVQLQEYKHCVNFSKTTEETGICAGLPGKDSCFGDSGGPLVLGDRLVGVVSHGPPASCGEDFGVYMDATYYRDWIQLHTGI